MAGKIAHAAERKGFELALNGVMKRAQGKRNEGYMDRGKSTGYGTDSAYGTRGRQ